MSVLNSQEYNREIVYTVGATATTGPFDIPFPFQDVDEITVLVDDVVVTAYTVSQPSEFGIEGNAVTFDDPVSNCVVTIISTTGESRSVAETFVQAELSKEIDRIFALFQELAQKFGRTVRLGYGEVAGVYYPEDGRSPVWDEANKSFTNGPTGDEIANANASALAAASSAASALAQASAAAASAAAALASETAAAASEAAAGASETAAAGSASAAAGSATTSQGWSDKAAEWAENPEDLEVEVGQFSALHHAAKAAAEAAAALASAGAADASATAAAGSASAAAASATAADGSATAAAGSASAAATSAGEAAGSATAAAGSAATAEAAAATLTREIFISDTGPTGGADGDIWFEY